MPALMWFRRDLRLSDNPALELAASGGDVAAVFILDPTLTRAAGLPRLNVLYRTLAALDQQLAGQLIVRYGRPETVLPDLCRELSVTSVHCARDFGPYGADRDNRVAQALAVPLVRTGSCYAVDPGTVGPVGGLKVYSAFYRSWLSHGWGAPGPSVTATWLQAATEVDLPALDPLAAGAARPEVGEDAARRAWRSYLGRGLQDYPQLRNRPDLDATSRMSVHLKWGTIHPRTLLHDLGQRDETYQKELAWREFYADVLHRRPETAREYYRPELLGLRLAHPGSEDRLLLAWQQGRTGYPIVDAGMRQLLAEGWMHNRVRMIVASFLVKDLHIDWTVGARHFMRHLIDGDLASNSHGWQWTAGTGTDAAPYFRVFNPTLQGTKFDPDGHYIRRYVPELAHLSAKYIHEPAKDPNGSPPEYPEPIVDHATEREVTLADYQAVRSRRSEPSQSDPG